MPEVSLRQPCRQHGCIPYEMGQIHRKIIARKCKTLLCVNQEHRREKAWEGGKGGGGREKTIYEVYIKKMVFVELTEERPQKRKLQNCKELMLMKCQNTNPGNKGKEELRILQVFKQTIDSHPFECLLIRDYTKILAFSWAEKSLRILIYYIILVAFSARDLSFS